VKIVRSEASFAVSKSFRLFTSVSEIIRIKMTDLHQRIPAREQINHPHQKPDVVPAAVSSSHTNIVATVGAAGLSVAEDVTGL
jgi:hypothetical protein